MSCSIGQAHKTKNQAVRNMQAHEVCMHAVCPATVAQEQLTHASYALVAM